MICKNCGKEIPEESKVCPLCNSPIEINTEQEPQIQERAQAEQPIQQQIQPPRSEQPVQYQPQETAALKKSKKPIIIIAAVCLVLVIAAVIGGMIFFDKTDSDVNNFEYTIQNNEVTITKYIGNGRKVAIPSMIENCPVTSIGVAAFEHCESVTSVELPDSAITIRYRAFTDCTNLKAVKIPDSVQYMQDGIFTGSENVVVHCSPGSYAEQYASFFSIQYSSDLPAASSEAYASNEASSSAASGEAETSLDESSDEADSSAESAAAKKYASIDEYINDELNSQMDYIRSMAASADSKIEIYADGSTLVLECTIEREFDTSNEEIMTALREVLDEKCNAEGAEEAIAPFLNDLKEGVEGESSLKIVYLAYDGTEIYSKDFS